MTQYVTAAPVGRSDYAPRYVANDGFDDGPGVVDSSRPRGDSVDPSATWVSSDYTGEESISVDGFVTATPSAALDVGPLPYVATPLRINVGIKSSGDSVNEARIDCWHTLSLVDQYVFVQAYMNLSANIVALYYEVADGALYFTRYGTEYAIPASPAGTNVRLGLEVHEGSAKLFFGDNLLETYAFEQMGAFTPSTTDISVGTASAVDFVQAEYLGGGTFTTTGDTPLVRFGTPAAVQTGTILHTAIQLDARPMFGTPVALGGLYQVLPTTGFSTLAMGDPAAHSAVTKTATGFASAGDVGWPRLIYAVSTTGFGGVTVPEPWLILGPYTKFGSPETYATFTGAHSGSLGPIALGAPRLTHAPCLASSVPDVVQIPTAYYTFGQTVVATPAYTPEDVKVGWPWSLASGPPGPWSGWAGGFGGTTAGSPTSLAPVTTQEIGWMEELFGAPVSGQTYGADGFAIATIGAPVASGLARAAGFKATTFGTPSNARAQPAVALHRPTRWGTPKSDILGTCKARGFYTVRWAQPTARTGDFRFASALHVAAQFGTPEARNTFRAVHLSPVVRYGRHLLRRNTTC